MSAAKKCDRCGSFYEYKSNPELWITIDKHPYPEEKIDLCQNCRDGLIEWLEECIDKNTGE